jgi:hypothetical protein
MTKLETYRDYLIGEGYHPSMHDDFLTFRHEGSTFVIPADEEDPGYFRILLPNIWRAPDEGLLGPAFVAASLVTANLKGAKVFVIGSSTSVSIEFFLPDPDAFRSVFGRSLGAMQAAARDFGVAMVLAQIRSAGSSTASEPPPSGELRWPPVE